VVLTTASAAVAPHGKLPGVFGLLGLTYYSALGGLSVARTTASPWSSASGPPLGGRRAALWQVLWRLRPCSRPVTGGAPLFLPLPGGLRAVQGVNTSVDFQASHCSPLTCTPTAL
jgi:hypothetical protein